MTTEEKPLHIVELRATNIKRIRAVCVRPDGSPLIIISGKNEQGKSSLLDAISMALGGADEIPLEPIRHGARAAESFLDLGEYTVERSFSASGPKLTVRDKDGVTQKSPQKLLDGLTSKVSFDPLQFMLKNPKEQDELLRKMVGIDFSAIDAKRAQAFDARSDVNREIKRLKGIEAESTWYDDMPVEPIDVAAMATKMTEHAKAVAARTSIESDVTQIKTRLSMRREAIAEMQKRVTDAETECDDLLTRIAKLEATMPPEPPPIADIQQELRAAEATNVKVRENVRFALTEKDRKKLEKRADELTDVINACDGEKAEQLSAAKFPIEGLSFDDAGPIFKGVPLKQASQAQQLRVSVAIGAAQNPRIRVMLVREGSRLDSESLKLLAELAKETNIQCWVERVEDGDPGCIVIEDGMIKETPAANAVEAEAKAS